MSIDDCKWPTPTAWRCLEVLRPPTRRASVLAAGGMPARIPAVSRRLDTCPARTAPGIENLSPSLPPSWRRSARRGGAPRRAPTRSRASQRPSAFSTSWPRRSSPRPQVAREQSRSRSASAIGALLDPARCSCSSCCPGGAPLDQETSRTPPDRGRRLLQSRPSAHATSRHRGARKLTYSVQPWSATPCWSARAGRRRARTAIWRLASRPRGAPIPRRSRSTTGAVDLDKAATYAARRRGATRAVAFYRAARLYPMALDLMPAFPRLGPQVSLGAGSQGRPRRRAGSATAPALVAPVAEPDLGARVQALSPPAARRGITECATCRHQGVTYEDFAARPASSGPRLLPAARLRSRVAERQSPTSAARIDLQYYAATTLASSKHPRHSFQFPGLRLASRPSSATGCPHPLTWRLSRAGPAARRSPARQRSTRRRAGHPGRHPQWFTAGRRPRHRAFPGRVTDVARPPGARLWRAHGSRVAEFTLMTSYRIADLAWPPHRLEAFLARAIRAARSASNYRRPRCAPPRCRSSRSPPTTRRGARRGHRRSRSLFPQRSRPSLLPSAPPTLRPTSTRSLPGALARLDRWPYVCRAGAGLSFARTYCGICGRAPRWAQRRPGRATRRSSRSPSRRPAIAAEMRGRAAGRLIPAVSRRAPR